MNDNEKWTVKRSTKANKAFIKLPDRAQAIFIALEKALKISGPIQHEWPNFSKLKKLEYHCHLNKKGHPTYVAVWIVEDKQIKIIEITYIGTRENAPYGK